MFCCLFVFLFLFLFCFFFFCFSFLTPDLFIKKNQRRNSIALCHKHQHHQHQHNNQQKLQLQNLKRATNLKMPSPPDDRPGRYYHGKQDGHKDYASDRGKTQHPSNVRLPREDNLYNSQVTVV